MLAYPKFHLDPLAIEQLLADLMPWRETWQKSLAPCGYVVRDPHDPMFLDLAVAAGVAALVSGDADLLALQNQCQPLLILGPAAFRLWLDDATLI